MDRFWNTLLIGPLLAAFSGPMRAAEPVDIPLRYISAQTAYAVVKDTPGLASVSVHARDNSLSLTGTEAGIGAAKSFLNLMDVPPREVAISARLMHFERDASGKVVETVLQKPVITAASNQKASLKFFVAGTSYRVEFTPRMNRDGTVTVESVLEDMNPSGMVRYASRTVRRLRQDTTKRLAGITASTDSLLRHAVESGEVVKDRSAYSAIYLDVTVRRVPEDADK